MSFSSIEDMAPTVITAGFDSECDECPMAIREGDRIARRDGDWEWSHEECIVEDA